jgi:hypothetical protein
MDLSSKYRELIRRSHVQRSLLADPCQKGRENRPTCKEVNKGKSALGAPWGSQLPLAVQSRSRVFQRSALDYYMVG